VGAEVLAVRIVFWWLVLCGLWLLYVGQHTKENAVAGAIAATIAVGFAALVARLGLYRFGLRARLLARGATLPWYLVRDFAVVTAALLRGRPGGRFVEYDFSPVRSPGDRALVGLLGSITPNAYVVDVDRDRGVVVLHELDPKRSRGAPV
jgi:multisubunit Na+/H+ antiporter MnhE subunit